MVWWRVGPNVGWAELASPTKKTRKIGGTRKLGPPYDYPQVPALLVALGDQDRGGSAVRRGLFLRERGEAVAARRRPIDAPGILEQHAHAAIGQDHRIEEADEMPPPVQAGGNRDAIQEGR